VTAPSSDAENGSAPGRLRSLARDPRAWLVMLAFVLRVTWILVVPSRPVGDFALYREAAEYLWDQGRLDSEFVYMPGYVFLLAGVRALGGGLLAAKMIGVVTGTLVVFCAGGIADALFGRRAGVVATALGALWPAGIAVTSVLGTDMPASAFGALGLTVLVRFAPRRPWLATILFGLTYGLAAWIRAVAAPLAILSLLYWLASGARWPQAAIRAATALAVALLVLSPWALRNRQVYGELFFTDTHGGNTALVGANPNTEGTYSRSLNLMFTKGTGYRLFEPPERQLPSDRAAYQLARSWTTFEPIYAAGLIAAKADRLLTTERNLLYWPVYRQGVLDGAQRSFFDGHRAAIERATDVTWWLLAALGAAGIALCVGSRAWAPLSILIFPLALIGTYTLFFAEVRYHLAIAPLLLPYAACAVDWAWSATRNRFRGEWRHTLLACGAVAFLFLCWAGLLELGNALRARHRWAVTVCAYPQAEETHLCRWRRALPVGGDSPIRGAWDGVGLRVDRPSQGVLASARTEIPIGAGRFRVRAEVSFVGAPTSPDAGLAVALRADGRVIARVVSPSVTTGSGAPLPIVGLLERSGGPVLLEVEVEPTGIRSVADGGTVWISKLIVERF
jgi:4-amino-4-deoxy-L-arabinose transferase-like glycosyltransferase